MFYLFDQLLSGHIKEKFKVRLGKKIINVWWHFLFGLISTFQFR